MYDPLSKFDVSISRASEVLHSWAKTFFPWRSMIWYKSFFVRELKTITLSILFKNSGLKYFLTSFITSFWLSESDFTLLTEDEILKRIELGQSLDIYKFNDKFSISTGGKFHFENKFLSQNSHQFFENNEIVIGLKFTF